MVPAHSTKYISIVFNVSSVVVPPEGVDCQSFGLGYMTLPDSHLDVDGRIYRQHQYDVRPLRVDMTGHVMAASLGVEHHDDDGMNFIVPASDLLDDNNQVIMLRLSSLTDIRLLCSWMSVKLFIFCEVRCGF